jgi:hypothetical protein
VDLMLRAKAGVTLLALAVSGIPETRAQDANLTAEYGELTLAAGFAPVQMTVPAGGFFNAGDLCGGAVSQAPSIRPTYTARDGALVISATAGARPFLSIVTPSGSIRGLGRNRIVRHSTPPSELLLRLVR